MEFHSEEELLDRVRRGDESAFDVLFVRHRAYALGVARRVVGRRDAEDAVAEAFARIFAILKNGGGPTTTFRPYLSVTVHNVAVNRLRSQSRELTTEPNDLIPLLVEDDASGRHLTNRVVRDAFTTLPARWQQVLWLCEVDRVPHEEVGELLGIKPNAVAALAVRARRSTPRPRTRPSAAGSSPTCPGTSTATSADRGGRPSTSTCGPAAPVPSPSSSSVRRAATSARCSLRSPCRWPRRERPGRRRPSAASGPSSVVRRARRSRPSSPRRPWPARWSASLWRRSAWPPRT
jgi:RNA polymerase sigma factor (sigma-70 family)